MKKISNLVIRIDANLKSDVAAISSHYGYSLTDVVTAALSDLRKKGKIPLNYFRYLPLKKILN